LKNPVEDVDTVLLAGSGPNWTDAGERVEGNLIGVSVQRLVVDAAKIGFGMQEKVSQHHGAKALNRGGKLFIWVVSGRQLPHFRRQHGIHLLAAVFPRFHFRPQGADRRCALIGFAEGHIKRRHFRAVLAKNVEHPGEVRPRKRPLAQHLLRMLVDVHDHDSRINRAPAAGSGSACPRKQIPTAGQN